MPLHKPDIVRLIRYPALYNETFINCEKDIGNGHSVETYDRNRLYDAIGYGVSDSLKIQGW